MCQLNNKDGKVGENNLMISKYDKLYKDIESANNALSIFDLLSGIEASQVENPRYIRRYSNPDMFYMDKTAGLMPLNSYITDSGKVYQIAV